MDCSNLNITGNILNLPIVLTNCFNFIFYYKIISITGAILQEGWIPENNKIIFEKQQFLDSVFKNKPHYSFKLTDISSNKINVDFWKIKDENSSTGWDVEYGYIRVNNNNELLRAQYFNWEILFKPLSFFTR